MRSFKLLLFAGIALIVTCGGTMSVLSFISGDTASSGTLNPATIAVASTVMYIGSGVGLAMTFFGLIGLSVVGAPAYKPMALPKAKAIPEIANDPLANCKQLIREIYGAKVLLANANFNSAELQAEIEDLYQSFLRLSANSAVFPKENEQIRKLEQSLGEVEPLVSQLSKVSGETNPDDYSKVQDAHIAIGTCGGILDQLLWSTPKHPLS